MPTVPAGPDFNEGPERTNLLCDNLKGLERLPRSGNVTPWTSKKSSPELWMPPCLHVSA